MPDPAPFDPAAPQWFVIADDRTGALETAGAIASTSLSGEAVWVVTRPADVRLACAAHDGVAAVVVADAATRHLTGDLATTRLAAFHAVPADRRAYKLDSMLRGVWADDLVTLAQLSSARVVVVAALPALGRSCRSGVVHLHGRPLRHADARASASSARPADHLRAAGADVVELADAAALAGWIASGQGAPFAVCDAVTDADLRSIGRVVAAGDVLFAGTSASVAAACSAGRDTATTPRVHDVVADGAAMRGGGDVGGSDGGPARPVSNRHILVVSGSAHPVAVAQIAALRATGLEPDIRVTIVAAPAPAHLPVDDIAARRTAADLAVRVHEQLAIAPVATMVIVGGDTAAAVLGDGPRLVGGVVGPGMPWSRALDGSGPVVVTKAGGFGEPGTLVEVLLGPSAARR